MTDEKRTYAKEMKKLRAIIFESMIEVEGIDKAAENAKKLLEAAKQQNPKSEREKIYIQFMNVETVLIFLETNKAKENEKLTVELLKMLYQEVKTLFEIIEETRENDGIENKINLC
ncbi:MAG: hypothetical protein M0P94_04530 [Candidatus Absconditabacterales bacterium]|nr:hypothetical protein [Candidatus Absconditabacterales bacterium]